MIRIICEEYLDEMATIYKNREYGILVAVNPDSKRSGNPYFKFYNNVSYDKATKVVRILFNYPDYVLHKDRMELWKLNSKEKKLLIKILKEESDMYDGYTNWDIAKYEWSLEYLEEPLNMAKYFKGEYDTIYKNNPGYIPSTLKMPDYTKLQF